MHFNWYWHQVSLDRADIEFRLIHLDSVDEAVGMIGYGQAYADEHLLEPIAGTYELAHLVMDPRHHHRGIGRVAARAVPATRPRPSNRIHRLPCTPPPRIGTKVGKRGFS